MRLTGHPGRAKALVRFIEHIVAQPQVWVCRREDIARHWIARFPAPAIVIAKLKQMAGLNLRYDYQGTEKLGRHSGTALQGRTGIRTQSNH